jgi:hypothetical protein
MLGRNMSPYQKRIVDEIMAKWFPDQTDGKMEDKILSNLGTVMHLREESDLQAALVCYIIAYAFEMTERFTFAINEVHNDYDKYPIYVRNPKLVSFMSGLRKVTSVEEFNDWVDEYGQYLPSNHIASGVPASLDSLFG